MKIELGDLDDSALSVVEKRLIEKVERVLRLCEERRRQYWANGNWYMANRFTQERGEIIALLNAIRFPSEAACKTEQGACDERVVDEWDLRAIEEVVALRRNDPERRPFDEYPPAEHQPVQTLSSEPSSPSAAKDHSAEDCPITFLNKVRDALGVTRIAGMKKDDLEAEIKQHWALEYPHNGLSAHMLSMMATMLRPLEAQQGRRRIRRDISS